MKIITSCSSVISMFTPWVFPSAENGWVLTEMMSSEPLIIKTCGFNHLERPTLADVSLLVWVLHTSMWIMYKWSTRQTSSTHGRVWTASMTHSELCVVGPQQHAAVCEADMLSRRRLHRRRQRSEVRGHRTAFWASRQEWQKSLH